MITPVSWEAVETRLRPFVERRVSASDVDDVMQDVFVRMQKGLASLRDEERFTSWLFQIARSSIAEHGRTRARHPRRRAMTTIATLRGHSLDVSRCSWHSYPRRIARS